MSLPTKYKWLEKETAPRILVEGLKLYGTLEKLGDANNPVIIQWAKETGISQYVLDSIPWCGLFMAVVCKRAGKEIVDSPLWARNWAKWGTKVPEAMLGDVVVFERTTGGHVGIYVGEDATAYHILGGNQSDSVNIVRIAKNRKIAIRRTTWQIAQPANVRKIYLSSGGALSTNEG
jgi:uncharacterized protein (TIGR02594 family)